MSTLNRTFPVYILVYGFTDEQEIQVRRYAIEDGDFSKNTTYLLQ